MKCYIVNIIITKNRGNEHQYAAYSYINLYSRTAIITVQYYVSMCLNVPAVLYCVTGIIVQRYVC